MPRILALLAPGFEEIEAVTPIDLLRRAGADVTLASLDETRLVTGRCGLALQTDTSLADVANTTFDCLFLPGGPGVRHLRQDPRVRDLLLAHHRAHHWIAAICAAPVVLHDAGLLHDRRHTAHFSVISELPNADTTSRVIVADRLITSRGAGTALDFGLALVTALFSQEKSDEIARSICA